MSASHEPILMAVRRRASKSDRARAAVAPGDGICNAVHVDDVVSASVTASHRDEAVGETCPLSGPDHPARLDPCRAHAQARWSQG